MTRQLENTDLSDGSWKEWSKYVLNEILRLSNDNEILKKEIQNLSLEVKTLGIKFTIYGSIAAFIATILVNIAISLIKGGK